MPHLLTYTHLSPAEGSTSTWVRSRRISKRILASLVSIVMVWDLVSSTPTTDVTPAEGVGPGRIFTNPTLIELRQVIGQYHWLRGAVTSFSALARSVRQS
ncbi:hypothetical protein AVEN_205840-1 [Araneus ventricosus]|uniref:Uncharacterized protein n=1 Tax=Araneus ventricosus TaxID=182803 RepID=A0A4Y2MPQ8_ARAVE|nr:hypothetical protein AVEN_205840-1 [Araneus ventricosus]